MVNDETLLLFCEVLDCPSPFVDTTLDPEVLFDFILYVRSVFITSSRIIGNLFPLAIA